MVIFARSFLVIIQILNCKKDPSVYDTFGHPENRETAFFIDLA
jgi:hypothetical protein